MVAAVASFLDAVSLMHLRCSNKACKDVVQRGTARVVLDRDADPGIVLQLARLRRITACRLGAAGSAHLCAALRALPAADVGMGRRLLSLDMTGCGMLDAGLSELCRVAKAGVLARLEHLYLDGMQGWTGGRLRRKTGMGAQGWVANMLTPLSTVWICFPQPPLIMLRHRQPVAKHSTCPDRGLSNQPALSSVPVLGGWVGPVPLGRSRAFDFQCQNPQCGAPPYCARRLPLQGTLSETTELRLCAAPSWQAPTRIYTPWCFKVLCQLWLFPRPACPGAIVHSVTAFHVSLHPPLLFQACSLVTRGT